MGKLITREDMIERFGAAEMAERTGRERCDVIDEAVLSAAIADAEAEAQSYLSAAGLVLATPPKALVVKVCDIARYYLYDDAVTQIVEDRYKQAIQWLRDVVRNPQMLDAAATAKTATPSRAAVVPNTPPKWADIGKD